MPNEVAKTAGKGTVRDSRIEAAWLKHAYDGFPREVWDGDRSNKWQLIRSREELTALLSRQHDNFGPAHTSINIGFGPVLGPQYSSRWVNKLLIELDARGGLESAYPEMRRLCAHLKLKYDAEPRIYFSGNRSFHVFVDFAPLVLSEPVEAQREFAQLAMKELALECPDLQVYGERKLSRVPLTMNEKTCNYCVPVSPYWTLEEMRRESRKPVRFHPIRIAHCERLAGKLREIDEELEGRPRPAKKSRSKGSTDWIEKFLDHPVADGRHRLLWHVLAPYLVNVKKLPLEQAESLLADYFKHCSEARPLQPSYSSFKRLIRYYLRIAERDGYPPLRLETIQTKDPQLFEIVKETVQS